MRTVIHNIGQLVAMPPGPVRGHAMGRVPVITEAALVTQDEKIAWFGRSTDTPAGPFDQTIDARGGCVTPGLVDCHTHAVFAGDRANEFVQRIGGATYEQIMHAGGGIRTTMRSVREASLGDLVAESAVRLHRMLACGTTTVEIKSGYGLDPDNELKMLRAIRKLSNMLPMDIVGTYLGAHAVPSEFDGRADEYIAVMTDERLLSTIRDEGLASFADAFCERGAFSPAQTTRFLESCKRFNLIPKIHAEQLSRTGATKLAIDLGASSSDHLEFISDEDIQALAASATIPVLLPGCNFFLGSKPAPARKMIEADLPVALATDCNPGSCTIESLGLMMSLACLEFKMTPLEALVACTANSAAAIRRETSVGAIAVGHQADLLVLDVPRIELWAYRFGVIPIRAVIKRGRILLEIR